MAGLPLFRSAFCAGRAAGLALCLSRRYPVGTTLEGTLRIKGPTLLRDTLTLKPLRLKDSHR
jgi:hypothetical protein